MLFFVAVLAILGSCLGDDKFPDSYRIEIELLLLETGGVDEKNIKCDSGVSPCDPYIAAFIDLGTPSKPFVSAAKQAVVVKKDNNDNPAINTIVAMDVCGGATNSVTLRAYVFDAEEKNGRTRIDDFDCSFMLSPKDVAGTGSGINTKWGIPVNCIAKTLPLKHKLTARIRAYNNNVPNCRLDDDMFSLQQTWIRGMRAPKTVPLLPAQHPNIRLEVDLIQLSNPGSVTQKGAACGVNNTQCNPMFMVRLDTDTPMTKPDRTGADTNGFTQLSQYNASSSPALKSNTVFRDICGGALNWVMLRVIVKNSPGNDQANWAKHPTIEDFECLTRIDYSTVAKLSESAAWGSTQACVHLNPSDISLQFRVRAYDIPLDQCIVEDRFGVQA